MTSGAYIERAHVALKSRDITGALEILLSAESLFPQDIQVRLTQALAYRLSGDHARAIAALDAALIIEPYSFLALLSKAALLERTGFPRQAAQIYQNALDAAPPADQIEPALAAPMARARQVVAENAQAARQFISDRLGTPPADMSGTAKTRLDQSLDVLLGLKRAYRSDPILLNYQGLPSIQFFDREVFPWLETLEAGTPIIQAELTALMRDQADEFAPYIAYPPGAPVNQWGELNHSRKWTSLWLWRDGQRQDAVCDRCPQTAALLASLPMADQPGFAPTAVFSALQPHTHIPPHTGSTNTRLLVHLPLILPGPARFRVGNETRDWKMGQAWVFDDTIEHEAWNDADETRVILIFDVWNPAVSLAEREMITAMLNAKNAFYS